MASDTQHQSTVEQIVARAIDPEAWDRAAWSGPGIDLAGTVLLTDMQDERQAKAMAKARAVTAALHAAGLRVMMA